MHDSETDAVAALIPDIGAMRAAVSRAAAADAAWAGLAAAAVELAAENAERCAGVPDRWADRAAWRVESVRDFLRRSGHYGTGEIGGPPASVVVRFTVPGPDAADRLFTFLRMEIGAPEPFAADPCPFPWSIESEGGDE